MKGLRYLYASQKICEDLYTVQPKDQEVHAKNILFRAQRGLNYPMDSQVLFQALKTVAPPDKLMRVLSKAVSEVFKLKEEAEHAED